MSLVKRFSVGNGDMCYIKHNSDNFTIINYNINSSNHRDIIDEIKAQSTGAWLRELDPKILIIGETPSRQLHYCTGYKK